MDWRLVLTLIAFAIYFVYNAIAVCRFGAPKSLSMTYYNFQDISPKLKWCFPVMMVLMAGLLMPAWIDLSEGHNLQFMSFLAAVGIIMVGFIPNFKDGRQESLMHTGAAIFAAVFALLWVCLVTNMWYVVLIWAVMLIAVAFLSGTWKTSYIYWLETVAFASTFTSIISYYLVHFYAV